ncbi:MAG TPA: hypothetical protein VH593_11015, partial [Ktedonobacteraceae bacterium]
MSDFDIRGTSTASNSFWTTLWHSQTITVARFTLGSYIRSWWILGNIVFIWLLYAAFFLETGSDVKYFYGVATPGLYILSILSAIVLTQRAMQARMYLPLARLNSRAAYTRGLILAISILCVLHFSFTLLLAMGYHRYAPSLGIQGATAGNMLPGVLGTILNCIILATLTVLLSAPIATRRIQIVFLIWLAGVLYSNTNTDLVAHYLSVIRVLLDPVVTCSTFGITETIDGYGLAMIVLAVGYIFVLSWLGEYWFSKR